MLRDWDRPLKSIEEVEEQPTETISEDYYVEKPLEEFSRAESTISDVTEKKAEIEKKLKDDMLNKMLNDMLVRSDIKPLREQPVQIPDLSSPEKKKKKKKKDKKQGDTESNTSSLYF